MDKYVCKYCLVVCIFPIVKDFYCFLHLFSSARLCTSSGLLMSLIQASYDLFVCRVVRAAVGQNYFRRVLHCCVYRSMCSRSFVVKKYSLY